MNMIGYYMLCMLIMYASSSSFKYDIFLKAFLYVILFVLFISMFFVWQDASFASGRFRGVLNNANVIGSISATVALAFFLMYIDSKNKIYFLFSIFSSILLLLSQSRTSVLSLVFTLCVYFIVFRKIESIIYIFYIILAFVIMQISFLYVPSDVVYSRDFLVENGRKAILMTYYDKFLEAPFWGYGLSIDGMNGRFKAELAYFDILTSSGIIGAIPFFIALFYSALKGIKLIPILNLTHKTATFVFILILFLSLGDGYISNIANPLPIFAWVYMGTLMKYE